MWYLLLPHRWIIYGNPSKDGDQQNNNELLAAKARLRRQPKSAGKLKVPEWMHEAWKTGDKTALAQTYKNVGFDKAWFGAEKSWFMLTWGLVHL